MLQLKSETSDLWDGILPPELRKLPKKLARQRITNVEYLKEKLVQ